MASLSVQPSSYGIALALIWVLIGTLFNAKAFVMLATILLYWIIQNITPRNLDAFVICSALYFYFANQGFIKLPSAFKFAFICFGFVYLAGAVDQFIYYHLDHDTRFDRIQPYLVTVINAYVLAYLLSDWRRNDVVGLANYCAMRYRRYKISGTHLQKLPSAKR